MKAARARFNPPKTRLPKRKFARHSQVSGLSWSRLEHALESTSYSHTAGLTHGFYNYPARFAPTIAREVIAAFTEPTDWVLDPFMGGGTSIIEGLVLGRRMIGVDVNALAHFVASVRTAPLSPNDQEILRRWAARCARLYGGPGPKVRKKSVLRNLPPAVEFFVAGSLNLASKLPSPRHEAFARCALLRLGQWALDCRDFVSPRRRMLARKLPELTDQMLLGLQEFTNGCRASGIPNRSIRRHRLLLTRTAVGLEEDPRILAAGVRPRLVLTSPPYPSVHVLYHRWQYRGRRETSAPYWIAGIADGHHTSFYMGGSRTPTGRIQYFEMITAAFRSVRSLIADDGFVVQLVGFSDTNRQLRRFLRAMEAAEFAEVRSSQNRPRLTRSVPNRKWHAKLQGRVDASSEVLLVHRPV